MITQNLSLFFVRQEKKKKEEIAGRGELRMCMMITRIFVSVVRMETWSLGMGQTEYTFVTWGLFVMVIGPRKCAMLNWHQYVDV